MDLLLGDIFVLCTLIFIIIMSCAYITATYYKPREIEYNPDEDIDGEELYENDYEYNYEDDEDDLLDKNGVRVRRVSMH